MYIYIYIHTYMHACTHVFSEALYFFLRRPPCHPSLHHARRSPASLGGSKVMLALLGYSELDARLAWMLGGLHCLVDNLAGYGARHRGHMGILSGLLGQRSIQVVSIRHPSRANPGVTEHPRATNTNPGVAEHLQATTASQLGRQCVHELPGGDEQRLDWLLGLRKLAVFRPPPCAAHPSDDSSRNFSVSDIYNEG